MKVLLRANGLVFLIRAAINLVRPTSFYVEDGAPKNAVDAVRVLGISYATLGLLQLNAGFAGSQAVRAASVASSAFAAAVMVQAATQGPGPDTYHRIRFAAAAENAVVATLYAVLLARDARRRAG